MFNSGNAKSIYGRYWGNDYYQQFFYIHIFIPCSVFALSCLFFLITIILTIHTFNSNTDYINILINDCISEEEDKFKCDMCRMKKSLGRLDKVSGFTFSISIVLAITFSFISIYTKYVQTTGGH